MRINRNHRVFLGIWAAALALATVGCGSQSEEAQFKSNFEDAVKAAEKGKGLIKAPAAGRRAPRNR